MNKAILRKNLTESIITDLLKLIAHMEMALESDGEVFVEESYILNITERALKSAMELKELEKKGN